MKKILTIIILSTLPIFTHTMETTSTMESSTSKPEVLATILATIKKELGDFQIIKRSLSPDATKIAIINDFGYISLWDATSGKLLDEIMARNKLNALSIGFNPESTKVVVTTPSGSEAFDIINPEVLATILATIKKELGDFRIVKRSLSPDGTKVAIINNFGYISLWDATSGKPLDEIMARNKLNALSIGFNPESTKVVVTTPNSSETLDIINPEVLALIKEELGSVQIVKKSLSPDGTKVAIINDLGFVSLWDATSGKLLEQMIALRKQNALSIEFNPDSTKVIVTTPEGTEEFSIKK